MNCSIKSCNRTMMESGMCHAHYVRVKKYGDAQEEIPIQRRTEYPSKYPYEYKIYRNIKARLFNPRNPYYKNYGGRGLTIDPAWRYDFEQFIKDIGARPSKELTLDRIDNDKGYVRGNMRWATRSVQTMNQRARRNKSGIRGVTKTKTGWMVRICKDRKRHCIGTFRTLDEARIARINAEDKYWNGIIRSVYIDT